MLSGFTKADVEELERRSLHDGFLKVSLRRLKHRLHGGGWSGEVRREVVERAPTVAVLPYDPAHDTVALVEQFRVGPHAAGEDPWMLEVIAGVIEPGQRAAAVAKREALEEAGLAIGDLVPVCTYYPSPGGLSEVMSVYVGRAELGPPPDGQSAPALFGLASEAEDIRRHILPFGDAMTLLVSDRIRNAPTIIALQWLSLNYDTLRTKRWASNKA